MILKFLGAGASEGIPAIFCRCAFCEEVRNSGKRFTRSQLSVDGKLLIDFPPDSYYRASERGVDLANVENIFVTHSHSDHFYADDFFMRGLAFSHGLKVRTLKIYASEAVTALLDKCGGGYPEGTYRHVPVGNCNGYEEYPQSTEYVNIRPYGKYLAGGYEVTALPAEHIPGEECFLFAVSGGGKSFLYATDTSLPSEKVFCFLKEKGYFFDAVIYDGTYGLLDKSEGHMNFSDAAAMRRRLFYGGVIGEKTLNILTHISHNAAADYTAFKNALPDGFTFAFDGRTVEL